VNLAHLLSVFFAMATVFPLLLAILSFLGAPAEPPTPPVAIAFTHVDVVPMDRERVLRDRTVVVEDGVIRATGPGGSVEIPRGAEVVDGTGRYLLPGLFDLHVHVQREYELPLYLAKGVITVFNLGGRPWHLELRERIAQRAVIGPRLFTCGPYIRGATDPAEAERQVEEIVAAGYDCVKIIDAWSAEAYRAPIWRSSSTRPSRSTTPSSDFEHGTGATSRTRIRPHRWAMWCGSWRAPPARPGSGSFPPRSSSTTICAAIPRPSMSWWGART
jgi:hypothetical protein